MDGAQQSQMIVGLDIGTSKIAVVVADMLPDATVKVIGFSKVSAEGISAGSVQDVELAVASIRRAIEEAEQISRRTITTVAVSLSGKHLHSVNKDGRLVLPENEVTPNDMQRVTRLAMTIDKKNDCRSEDDRVVSHIVKGYTLDADTVLLEDPVGMAGTVLRSHVHLALGSDSIVLNLIKCIRKASLDLECMILQPWASAACCLTKTEKELGVILLDIGAGTIDIAFYCKGNIEYTAVVAAGGDVFTRDIAAGLGCTLDDAEDIKLSYAHMGVRPEDRFEKIRYTYELDHSERETSCEDLVNIVQSRAVELIDLLNKYYLEPYRELAASGVVITGGVARMPGFDRVVSEQLGLRVRVGAPKGSKSNLVNLVSTDDSTVMGVLVETVQRRTRNGKAKLASGHLQGFWGSMKRIMFGDFSS